MGELIELKKKYNALLARNSKAENYLNTHSFEESSLLLKKNNQYILDTKKQTMNAFKLFDEIAIELSTLKIEIETLIYRDMSHDEVMNGFKV